MNDDQLNPDKPLFTEQDWDELFSMLSLDNSEDAYSRVGLLLPNYRDFQLRLRECMLQSRPESERWPAEKAEHKPVLLCLQSRLHHDVYETFLRWSGAAFLGNHPSQPHFSGWNMVFLEWIAVNNRPKSVPAATLGWLMGLQREMYEQHEPFWKVEIPKIKQRPLSEWDVGIYNRHGWNHFAQFDNPFLSLSLMASVYDTQELFKAANAQLSPDVLEHLRVEAQARLEKLEVWMPGPLESIPTLVSRL